MTFRLYFTCIFLLLVHFVFAQVTIKGEMRLGDTTQVHILNTKSGDRLIGRVIGFDNEEVVFLFKNQSKLVFPLSEILSIEAKADQPLPSPAQQTRFDTLQGQSGFLYLLSRSDGRKTSGRITRCDNRNLKVAQNKGPGLLISWRDLDSIELISPPINHGDVKPQELHLLKTVRGDQFAGQLLSYGSGAFQFMLENGVVLSFSPQDVSSIRLEARQVGIEEAGQKEFESTAADKLFINHTAFMPKRTEIYYRNLMVFYNSIDYGITDQISVGASLMPIVAINIAALKVKAGFELGEYVNLGIAGQAYGLSLLLEDAAGVVLGMGTLTFGIRDRHLNIGIGRGYGINSGGDLELDSNAFTSFNLGGSFRTGKKSRLFAEHVRILEQISYSVIGASFFNQRNRLDFGISLLQDGDELTGIPLVGYIYQF